MEKFISFLIDVVDKSRKLKGEISTIGITNQRETTILWDKFSGKPVYNAIVWQDRRTADFCKKFKSNKRENLINLNVRSIIMQIDLKDLPKDRSQDLTIDFFEDRILKLEDSVEDLKDLVRKNGNH